MTKDEFRAKLWMLGFNQSTFALRLNQLGDPRPFLRVLRCIQNYAGGTSKVPGELIVVLALMERFPDARGSIPQRPRGRPPRP